jgi:hypothetical protein
MNLHELGFEEHIIIDSDERLDKRPEVLRILKKAGFTMEGSGHVYYLPTKIAGTDWYCKTLLKTHDKQTIEKSTIYTDESFLSKYNILLEAQKKTQQPKPSFKVGDFVTFKSAKNCKNSQGRVKYWFGGNDQAGIYQSIREYLDYIPEAGCYKISVFINDNDRSYSMLESEFEEYDQIKQYPMTPQDSTSFPEHWYLPEVDASKQEVIDLMNKWRGGSIFRLEHDTKILVSQHDTDSSKYYFLSKSKFFKHAENGILKHQLITEEQFVAHYYPKEFQSIFNKSLTIKQFNYGLQESSQSITRRVPQPVTTGQRLSGVSVSGRTKKAAITVRPIVYQAISSE